MARVLVLLTIAHSTGVLGPVNSFAAGAEDDRRSVTVAVPRSFPPHYVVREDGRVTGFAIDIMNELADRAGLDVRYEVFDSWEGATRALRDGQVDLIPNMGITEERRDWGQFSAPYESFRVRLFVRADSDPVLRFEDLQGRTVGAAASNIAETVLPEVTGAEPRTFANAESLLRALVAGDIDVAAYPAPTFEQIAHNLALRDEIQRTGPSLATVQRGILVAENRTDLLATIEPHLHDLIGSVRIEKIYARWFLPTQKLDQQYWQQGIALTIVFLLAFIAAMAWMFRRILPHDIATDRRNGIEQRLLRRTVALAIALSMVAMAATLLIVFFLYRLNFDQHRAELVNTLSTTKALIEAVARFDRQFTLYPEGAYEGTLSQIRDGLSDLDEFHEIIIAERNDDRIDLLLRQRAVNFGSPWSFEFDSDVGEPARRAVSGQTGSMVGPDYRGVDVLAAYAPLPSLGLGLVIKEDVNHIRAPYLQAAGAVIVLVISFGLLGGGTYILVTFPIVRDVVRSEERFALFMQSANDGLWDWDARTDRVYFSPQWKSMLGYAEDEISDDFDEWRRRVHPDDLPAVLEHIDDYLAGNRPNIRVEFRMRHKDGRWIYILGRGYGVWNKEGKCVRLIGTHVDVTDQKEAQRRVTAYARFARENPNPVMRIDRYGDVIVANAAAQQFLGNLASEEAPQAVRAGRQAWHELLSHARMVKSVEQYEIDCSGRVYLFDIVPGKAAEDINLFAIDITRRKRAEQGLAESEAQLRSITDNLPVLIAYVAANEDFTYRFINPTGESWYARPHDDIVGKPAATVLGSEASPILIPKLQRAARGESVDFETSITYPDGIKRDVEIAYVPHFGPHGEVDGIFGLVLDITERKRVENALRDSEAQLRLVTDALPVMIAYIGDDYTYRFVNAIAEAWYARPRDAIIGKRIDEVLDTRAAQIVETNLAEVLSGDRVNYEVTIPYPDGATRDVELTYLPHRDTAGKITGVFSLTVDLTERKATEAQLQQAQKMDAIGQLTGGIAHDFNNLLTVIIGNLQLLERQVKDDERLARQAASAHRAAQRGAELTKRLLGFARKQVLEPQVVDVNDLVAGMDTLLQRSIGEDVEMRTSLADDLPPIRVDPNQLESVLLNLAVNARDAMPKGGKLTIETHNVKLDEAYAAQHAEVTAGPYVMVAVTDTGSGMPPETVKRIFEPFFTTKEQEKGTGLGLSMVYGFVKQSGGHIKAYSEVGRGTTFRIYLPTAEADAAAQRAKPTAAAHAVARGELVMLVEDDADVAEIAAEMLGDLGYEVVTATNGPEALELLDRHDGIDLLLTDVVMPGGMDGPELARRVKEQRPNIKVLFSSGYTANAIAHGGILDEGVELVQKPFTREELSRKVRHVLDDTGGHDSR